MPSPAGLINPSNGWPPSAAVGDHKGRLLPKLRRAQPKAAQLHLLALRLADGIGRSLNSADSQIRNRPRHASGKKEERGCPGIQQQMCRKIVHLRVDDRQATCHVQGDGIGQGRKGAKVDLARRVVNHEGALAQHIQTDDPVDADWERFLQEG